jgi:putative transposase
MGYDTDLTDAQWQVIEPIFIAITGNYGNRAKWSKRELTNAVLYLVKTGCQWRMLPKDFPPYSTVHDFFRRMRIKGIWEQINDLLLEKVCISAGRVAKPTYAFIDAQSAKPTSAALERDIDGGKKDKR